MYSSVGTDCLFPLFIDQHLLPHNCHHILQFNCRTMVAVQPIPPQLSVAFPCFPSCFVLLLEGEVCAGLISITVSSFPITPQTPAGCLFTFRNKKWACAREDVPLIRDESPPPTPSPPPLPPQGSTSQILLPSHQRQSQSCGLSRSLSVLSPQTVFRPLSVAFRPAPLLFPTVQLSNHIK